MRQPNRYDYRPIIPMIFSSGYFSAKIISGSLCTFVRLRADSAVDKEVVRVDVRGIDNLQYGYQQMKTPIPESNIPETDSLQSDMKPVESVSAEKDRDEEPLSEQEQQQRLRRLQDTLKNHNIEISYNDEVNRYAIKVLDSESKEVVKEIPSEKSLEMFARMLEIEGLLVDEKRY